MSKTPEIAAIEQPEKGYTPQDFADEYNALCQRTGYGLTASLEFVPTNHGTFEIAATQKIIKAKE